MQRPDSLRPVVGQTHHIPYIIFLHQAEGTKIILQIREACPRVMIIQIDAFLLSDGIQQDVHVLNTIPTALRKVSC